MATNMAPAHVCPDITDPWSCCRKALAQQAGAPADSYTGRDSVPVFFNDQDTELESPCRTESRAVCHAWKKNGQGKFINRGKAFRLHRRALVQYTYFISRSPETAATISYDEMQANAGITNDPIGLPANRATVRKARQKVRAIGRGLRDDRAVLAFGKWPLRLGGEIVAVQ